MANRSWTPSRFTAANLVVKEAETVFRKSSGVVKLPACGWARANGRSDALSLRFDIVLKPGDAAHECRPPPRTRESDALCANHMPQRPPGFCAAESREFPPRRSRQAGLHRGGFRQR